MPQRNTITYLLQFLVVMSLFSITASRADLFTCENGNQFQGQFAPDGDSVTLYLNGEAITFESAISASGVRYLSLGGYELWGKGNNYLFTPPGLAMTRCTRKPGTLDADAIQRLTVQPRENKEPIRIWGTESFDDKVIATDCRDDCEEDLGILLECSAPNRPIEIRVPWAAVDKGKEDAPVSVQFEVDGRVFMYQGSTEYSGLIGYLPKLQTPLSSPFFESLARGKKLTVRSAGDPIQISLRGSAAALSEFTASCAALPRAMAANAPSMATPLAATHPDGQQSPVPPYKASNSLSQDQRPVPINPIPYQDPPANTPAAPSAPRQPPIAAGPNAPPTEHPPFQPSEDGLTWQFYEDPQEGTAWLTYGIPETDATTVNLECRKNQPGSVQLTFFATPAGLESGTPTQITLGLPDRSLPSFRGNVDQRGLAIIATGMEANSLYDKFAGAPGDREDILILINGQAAGKVRSFSGTSQGERFQRFCRP